MSLFAVIIFCCVESLREENSLEVQHQKIIQSSFYSCYYAGACNKWRAHLRGFAPVQHCSVQTSQQWRAVGKTESDLIAMGIEPRPLEWIAMCSAIELIFYYVKSLPGKLRTLFSLFVRIKWGTKPKHLKQAFHPLRERLCLH